jgi:DNA-binding transcriptional LysR family regulator
MDLNDIPLFVRIAEVGSLAAVAEELSTQRSSISRRLARLEESLGVRLFQRTTRKLALTDAGQLFFDRVRGVIADVDEIANAVREVGGEPRGTVRLTAPPDARQFGLGEAIAAFMLRYPAIRVEISLTSRVVDLVGEGIDIAVRAGRLVDSTLVARKIGVSMRALFAAPSYLKRAGTPRSLADLKRHAVIAYRSRASTTHMHLTGPKGEESVEVQGNLSVDEIGFVLEACVAGAGIALLPGELAGKPAHEGRLERVLPGYYDDGGAVYVVLPSSTFVPARVALLRDHLVAHLEKQMAEVNRECSGAHGTPRGRRRDG